MGKSYKKTVQKIRAKVTGKKIWMYKDDGTDSQGCCVTNIGRHNRRWNINCELVKWIQLTKVFDRSFNMTNIIVTERCCIKNASAGGVEETCRGMLWDLEEW